MTSSSHEREVPRVRFLTGASFRMRSELAPQTLAAGAVALSRSGEMSGPVRNIRATGA